MAVRLDEKLDMIIWKYKEKDMKWKVEYNNDTGRNDESFFEWWEVTDTKRTFKADSEVSASWLCDALNQSGV